MSVLEEIQDDAPCSDHPLQTTSFRLLQENGKTPPSVYDTWKNQDRAPSSHAHQDAEEAAIYLYTFKDEAERLRSPEPSSWHDWGATTLRHAVKFRRGEKSSGVYQFGFMIPTAAPTGRREPVGDEATITPRRANHNLVCEDSKEATSIALTANSYDPA